MINYGGPRLALLARLWESVQWDGGVRKTETDPWDYLRRKLESTADPLRAFKRELFDGACRALIDDLTKPMLPPGSLERHREAFDALLTLSDYADLSFYLDPGSDPATRLSQVRSVLRNVRLVTLFDLESLPAERRGPAWNKRVDEMSRRLGLEPLERIIRTRTASDFRRTLIARRMRVRLKEYITVAHGAGHLRDEITPFMLSRIEAAIAASLRLFIFWR